MTSKELTQAEHDAIEALIDRYNLAVVVEAIADICEDKAMHIRENWQDEPLSRDWDYAAKRIQGAAISPAVKAVCR